MTLPPDLKKFAQSARRQLRDEVSRRLEQVLRTDSAELRQKQPAIRELQDQIARTSKAEVIDRVAYIWFNRFCALRFMDLNHYTRLGVVSPADGFSQPEILQEAKRGYIEDDLQAYVDRSTVFALLNGQQPASDPQNEAYHLLLVATCNAYNPVMPFLFEKIADYTELLMPLDLLSEHSVLYALRAAMTVENCQDVEVIGWLYQYYISERKDEVFAALKQNQKIEAQDIPAATQLFTPHWIVRYLVENSLGRLWMLNHPESKLVEKMDYYIAPAQPETDFLRITSPEELRVLDPACGSGHILTYAFDLLAAIYAESGYAETEIARLILQKNLYGIEIDARAGALAAFALTMKARAKDRRFFTRTVPKDSHGGENPARKPSERLPVLPNICVLENIRFTDQELADYTQAVGSDLFTAALRQTLTQFEQADNFGALIRPMLTDAGYVRGLLHNKNLGGNIFLYSVHQRVLKVLQMAEYLAPRYHVVVANPPYMSSGGMNSEMKDFADSYYEDSKADTYAMFIVKNLEMTVQQGFVGMITIPNWMFLSSFEKLRGQLLSKSHLSSLIHNGRGVWGSDFGSCAFVINKDKNASAVGYFKRLFIKQGEVNSNRDLQNRFFDNKNFPIFRVSPDQFFKIPGSPIAYWATKNYYSAFEDGKILSEFAAPKQGTSTGNNEIFLRLWFEVSKTNINFNCTSQSISAISSEKWYPATKGGIFRKWYGNNDYIVNWHKNGSAIRDYQGSAIRNPDANFLEAITWTGVSASKFGVRYCPQGFVFTISGKGIIFNRSSDLKFVLSMMASKVAMSILDFLTPTISFEVGYISKLPVLVKNIDQSPIISLAERSIHLSKQDWDFYEISWDFVASPLLLNKHQGLSLSITYASLRNVWLSMTDEMLRLETENNRAFINIYGLQDELFPDVDLEEATLTCNPYYRYGGNKTEEELEELLLADTMKEFLSYAVGCMFGRYSLDKPGLVLANQGETLKDYLKQVPKPTFTPDEDNVIPVLEGEWFNDDIAERFKQFLRVTFGEAHYEENLAFIEAAIGRDVRSYFVKEFYKDHVQTYKKRPIYWMFSSPKGSFNALIYLHRYQPDTVSLVLKYLRDFRIKLEARKAFLEQVSISASATAREKTAAIKEIEKLNKTLEELRSYERVTLFPLAAQRLTIDLDDGVKVNYGKFGEALAKIKGI